MRALSSPLPSRLRAGRALGVAKGLLHTFPCRLSVAASSLAPAATATSNGVPHPTGTQQQKGAGEKEHNPTTTHDATASAAGASTGSTAPVLEGSPIASTSGPFQLRPVHAAIFLLVFIGGALSAVGTLTFTADMELSTAVATVVRRLAKSPALRQLVVISTTIVVLRYGMDSFLRTLAKFSSSPVQWDKSRLFYILREVYQPLELLLFIAALCTLADSFVPSLIAVPKATVSHVVKSVLSTSFIIASASVVFNLKSRFCKENAWQAEMKGDVTTQRRWEAYDKLGTFVIYTMSFVLGIQALGLEITSVLAIGGIGGLAIGLAGREICENLLNGFLIMSTNPFEVGDEISFFHNNKTIEGFVIDIGWYRTNVRSWEREVYVIPNAVFSKNIVLNVSRKHREWRFYEVLCMRVQDINKANMVVQDIRRIVRNDTRVINKLHRRVFLDKITQDSVQIYLSFYLEAANRDAFMAIKQDLLVSFVECVEKHGGKLATPRIVVDMDPEVADMINTVNPVMSSVTAFAAAQNMQQQQGLGPMVQRVLAAPLAGNGTSSNGVMGGANMTPAASSTAAGAGGAATAPAPVITTVVAEASPVPPAPSPPPQAPQTTSSTVLTPPPLQTSGGQQQQQVSPPGSPTTAAPQAGAGLQGTSSSSSPQSTSKKQQPVVNGTPVQPAIPVDALNAAGTKSSSSSTGSGSRGSSPPRTPQPAVAAAVSSPPPLSHSTTSSSSSSPSLSGGSTSSSSSSPPPPPLQPTQPATAPAPAGASPQQQVTTMAGSQDGRVAPPAAGAAPQGPTRGSSPGQVVQPLPAMNAVPSQPPSSSLPGGLPVAPGGLGAGTPGPSKVGEVIVAPQSSTVVAVPASGAPVAYVPPPPPQVSNNVVSIVSTPSQGQSVTAGSGAGSSSSSSSAAASSSKLAPASASYGTSVAVAVTQAPVAVAAQQQQQVLRSTPQVTTAPSPARQVAAQSQPQQAPTLQPTGSPTQDGSPVAARSFQPTMQQQHQQQQGPSPSSSQDQAAAPVQGGGVLHTILRRVATIIFESPSSGPPPPPT